MGKRRLTTREIRAYCQSVQRTKRTKTVRPSLVPQSVPAHSSIPSIPIAAETRSIPLDLIESMYSEKCSSPSDINELLPLIRKYATGCEHVTELGVRCVVSTWALLAANPKRLLSVDSSYHQNMERAKTASQEAGIKLDFVIADDLSLAPEYTDFLFIDTSHTYEQLKAELSLYSPFVRKFIALHDTVTYGENLRPAITQFLFSNPDWHVAEDVLTNNGLMILGKSSIPKNMVIKAITMFYNEEMIAPFFLSHYKNIDEIIVLLESDTDDNTADICKAFPNCTLKNIHIDGGLNDQKKVEIINAEIKRQRDSDWVYILDSDELIVPYKFESPYKFLKRQDEKRNNIVNAYLFQVYRHHSEKPLNPNIPALPQRLHGDLDIGSRAESPHRPSNNCYIKPIIVKPNDIAFGFGNHTIVGKNRVISEEFYIGSHWQMADPDLAVARRLNRKNRMSKTNLQNGWGIQHWNVTKEWILEECRRRANDPPIGVLHE